MSVQTVDHFFNPSSKDFIHDPVPTLEKLCAEYPISRFDAWQAWLVTGHANIIKCLLDTRLSTDFNLWEYAPPKKPVDEMDAFEKLMNNNLFFLDRKNHLRLRKLALPAFSPRIMEQMKERFSVLVKERFDEILDKISEFMKICLITGIRDFTSVRDSKDIVECTTIIECTDSSSIVVC